MSFKLPVNNQVELSAEVAVDLSKVKRPQYGRYLDEFVPGQLFIHPRGFTFNNANIEAFSRTYMQTNPLYLNKEYAFAHGFEDILASPQMVFNVVLSLGVQNDSEKAIANLGYYNATFLNPVYPGDTINSMTKVMDRRERGENKPGIVTIRTLGTNQKNEVVLQYTRKIMVSAQGNRLPTTPLSTEKAPEFPWQDEPVANLPDFDTSKFKHLSGTQSYFENFNVGDIIAHPNGRTITDEHLALTFAVGNTHPLHFDKVYSKGLTGKMSGEPIVYGGLAFAWLDGLASRDISENALWEVGFTEGYHTQPLITNNTLACLSRVLKTESINDQVGVVTFQFIGVKNISANEAIEKYGEELFIKENAKKALGKEKIADKVFEIERKILIKKLKSN